MSVVASHAGLQLQDRYILDEVVANGALAVVYRGRDTVLSRPIAVKAVAPDRATYYRSALHATASFTHPAVIADYDAIEHDGWLFLIQEFVAARSLTSFLRSGLPVERAIDLIGQVARTLAYAHAHDVVHGDLTPAAVLVDHRAVVRINNFALPPDDAYFTDAIALLERDSPLKATQTAKAAGGDGAASTAIGSENVPTVELNVVTGEPAPAGDIRAAGLLLWQLLSEPSGTWRTFRLEVPEDVRELARRCVVLSHPQPISDADALVIALESLARELEEQRPGASQLTPPALRAARASVERSAAWSIDDTVGGSMRWDADPSGLSLDPAFDYPPTVPATREKVVTPAPPTGPAPSSEWLGGSPSPYRRHSSRQAAPSASRADAALPPRWPSPSSAPLGSRRTASERRGGPASRSSADYYSMRVRSRPLPPANTGINLTALILIGVALFVLFFVIGVVAPPIFGQ